MRASTSGRVAAAAALVLALGSATAKAQAPGAGDGVRFGVSLGGISTASLVVELYRDTHAVELALGTWSFKDLSISAVGKEYFGPSRLRPFVGGGLWAVVAHPSDERTGLALVLRAPVGVDMRIADRHAAGAALDVNWGLWVRRSDPDDNLPMNRRFVPLPEVYYRFTR